MVLFCFELVLSLLFLFIVHETAHYMVALILYKKKLKFQFSLGELFGMNIVPRYIWYIPTKLLKDEKRVIALSGFYFEFLFALAVFAFSGCSLLVTLSVIHFLLYPLYADTYNDFKLF